MFVLKNIIIAAIFAISPTGSFEDESCPVSILNPPEVSLYLLYNRLSNDIAAKELSVKTLEKFSFENHRTRPLLESHACYQDIGSDVHCAIWVEREKFEKYEQGKGKKCRLSEKLSPNELFGILFSQYYILNGLDKRTYNYCDRISVGRFKDVSYIEKYVKENIKPVGFIDTSVGDQFYYGTILKGLIYFARGMQENEPGFVQRAKGYFGGAGGDIIIAPKLEKFATSNCYQPLRTFGRNARSIANLTRVNDPKMKPSLRESITILELNSLVTGSLLNRNSVLRADIEQISIIKNQYAPQLSEELQSKLPNLEIISFAYQTLTSLPSGTKENKK